MLWGWQIRHLEWNLLLVLVDLLYLVIKIPYSTGLLLNLYTISGISILLMSWHHLRVSTRRRLKIWLALLGILECWLWSWWHQGPLDVNLCHLLGLETLVVHHICIYRRLHISCILSWEIIFRVWILRGDSVIHCSIWNHTNAHIYCMMLLWILILELLVVLVLLRHNLLLILLYVASLRLVRGLVGNVLVRVIIRIAHSYVKVSIF